MASTQDALFQPLAGVRVVEVSGEMGALAGRLLADLGAEVIRVEPPEGDALRRRPPFLESGPELERSLAHQHYNAGKRSFACNLENDEGRRQLATLLDGADIFLLEDELARRFALRGAWYATLPHRLIRTRMRAFSADSPRAAAPVTDLVGMAASGELYLTGFPDRAPQYPNSQLAYAMVSVVAATGAVAALWKRRRSGVGHEISACMQEAVALATTELGNVNAWLEIEVTPRRAGQLHPRGGGPMRASDGRWFVFNFFVFRTLADWFLDEGLIDEPFGPEWNDGEYAASRFREVTEPLLRELCSRYPAEKLIAEGQRRGLLNLPVNEVDEVLADPIMRERNHFFELPIEDAGVSLPFQRMPYVTSRGVARATRAAPRLGADNGALLAAPGKAETAEPGGAPSSDSTPLLQGLRVADFTTAVAGPLATRILANLGAEVLKVESRRRPDVARYVGLTLEQLPKTLDTACLFNDVNTAKQSVCLNLTSPRGVELALELVSHCDVVMSNFASAGSMERLGLGSEVLAQARPGVISLSSSTVGANRDGLAYRAFGTAITAVAGHNAISGSEGEPPVGLGTAHSDYTGPYLAALALLAALYERDRTGKGVHIDMSQVEGAAWLLDTKLMEYTVTGRRPRRIGSHSEWMAPHGIYRCQGEDAWCALAVRGDEDWKRLCSAIGREDLAADASLADFAGRKAAETRLDEILAAWCGEREKWEAATTFNEAGVPASPVETNRDLAERDPGMRGLFEDLPLSDGVTLRIMGDPIQVDGRRLPIRRAPQLGEHNARVLSDLLGYSSEEMAQLHAEGAID